MPSHVDPLGQKSGMFGAVFCFCWSYWRRHPRRIIGMLTLILLATSIEACIPLQLGKLVDHVSKGENSAAVLAVTLVVGAGAALAVLRYVSSRLLMRVTMTVMREMAEEGFSRVQRFSTQWHASTLSGSTVRDITRGIWGYDVLADMIVLGFFPALVLLCSIIGLMTWHWGVMGGVIATGSIVYIALAIVLVWKLVTPEARNSSRWDSAMNGALSDAITCNAVVRSFAAEEREESRLFAIIGRWQNAITLAWSRYILTGFVQNGVALVMQGATLWLGLWLWRHGRAGPGDIVYLVTTFTLLAAYLREVANHVRGLLRSVSDIEALARFSSQPAGIQNTPNAVSLVVHEGSIRLENVSFVYPGRSEPLYTNLSLDIEAGSHVGLVGPSGSGKSTFVKLLQRLFDVDSGKILIDGQNIAEVTQESLHRAIAVVAQEPILFHRSLAENIAYAKPDASRAEIVAAAKRVYAHDFIVNLPLGYDTPVGERGVKLSGGERQRIALARALLADAPILILDEATSSVDSVSECLLQRAIEEVAADRTTIIIAHRLCTVKRVDRILVFNDGKIIEDGAHHHLLAKSTGHYRRLFETQRLGIVDDEPLSLEW